MVIIVAACVNRLDIRLAVGFIVLVMVVNVFGMDQLRHQFRVLTLEVAVPQVALVPPVVAAAPQVHLLHLVVVAVHRSAIILCVSSLTVVGERVLVQTMSGSGDLVRPQHIPVPERIRVLVRRLRHKIAPEPSPATSSMPLITPFVRVVSQDWGLVAGR